MTACPEIDNQGLRRHTDTVDPNDVDSSTNCQLAKTTHISRILPTCTNSYAYRKIAQSTGAYIVGRGRSTRLSDMRRGKLSGCLGVAPKNPSQQTALPPDYTHSVQHDRQQTKQRLIRCCKYWMVLVEMVVSDQISAYRPVRVLTFLEHRMP